MINIAAESFVINSITYEKELSEVEVLESKRNWLRNKFPLLKKFIKAKTVKIYLPIINVTRNISQS